MVKPTLTFVGAEWKVFKKPLRFDGVLVVWPKRLVELIGAAGPLTPAEIEDLARSLVARLPRA